MKIIALIFALLAYTTTWSKAPNDESDYLKPFATITGSMVNSGWFQSASIGKEFSFYFGMPINLVFVNGSDRSYEKTYSGGTSQQPYDTTYLSATAFSNHIGAAIREPLYGPDGSVVDYTNHNLSDGISYLGDLSILPFLTLQFGFAMYNTELKLRYIGMPTIAGVSAHFPGFGLQHDFGKSLIKKELPVDLSIATFMSFPMMSVYPDYSENDTEQLSFESSGMAGFVGLVVGRKYKSFEFFVETGYEYSSSTFNGEQKMDGESLVTSYSDVELSGRNGFKLAVNVSAALGPWLPIISQTFGANFGNTFNLISFKK